MLSNTQLTVIRTVATAVVAGLVTFQSLYPSYTWIAAVTAAFATLGIHAIPSIQQVTTKGSIMPEIDGLAAMGLKPAVQTPEAPQSAPETAQPPETAPETQPAPVVMSNPAPAAPAAADNSAARQALTDAANALLKIAESL